MQSGNLLPTLSEAEEANHPDINYKQNILATDCIFWDGFLHGLEEVNIILPTFFLVCVDPEQEIQQFVIIAVVIQWLRM